MGFWTYDQSDFNERPGVQKLVHACLFAQPEPKFLYALVNYCYHFFLLDELKVDEYPSEPGGSHVPTHPKWNEFFLPSANDYSGSPLWYGRRGLSGYLLNAVVDDRYEPATLPALVAWALVWYHKISVPAEEESDWEPHLLGSPPVETQTVDVIYPIGLRDSLRYSAVLEQGDNSVFKVFNRFVVDVMDHAVLRTERVADDGAKFWYLPGDDHPPITRSGGLDSRAFFLMCFKAFCTVFSQRDTASIGTIDTTHLMMIASSMAGHRILPEVYDELKADPGVLFHGRHTDTFPFAFRIPSSFDSRRRNASNMCAVQDPDDDWTYFTDVKRTTDNQLKKMVTGLSHLGAIRRGVNEARVMLGNATVGNNATPIIKEFFPKAGTDEQQEQGKVMFSRFGEGHMTNILRSSARTLPYIALDPAAVTPPPTIAAFLPYDRRMGGLATNPHGGRANMLNSMLVRDPTFSVSADNIFDPTNAKVVCMGLPAGGVRALHTPSTSLTNVTIRAGEPSSLSDTFARDDSLLKVSLTKIDPLLPDVTYSDVEFFYDPRLWVAADGFDECISDIPLISQLHKVKFMRAVVDATGEVRVEKTYVGGGPEEDAYQEGIGFDAGGSLANTSALVAKQIAYVTARSDLLRLYTSLVGGLELGEESFHIEEGLMDQRIDSHMTVGDYLSHDIIPPIPAINDFQFPDMGTAPSFEGMSDWAEQPYGDFGTFRIKSLSGLVLSNPDISPSSLVYSQQFLSSLLFKPHTARAEMLFPKRFDGVLFFLVDPDMFLVRTFDAMEDIAEMTRTYLEVADLALEYPGESGEYYVIKSGNNEDAAGVIELTVSLTPASSTFSSACPGTVMLEELV